MFISKNSIVRTITIIFLFFIIVTTYQSQIIGKIFYPFPYKDTVEKYATAYGVDPLLVIAVIREESRFSAAAASSKGAVGLMQLMPDTAKEIAAWLGEDMENVDLEKPDDNIRYGTWYLSSLNKEFSGNSILVLASYNAGSGKVKSWIKTSQRDNNNYLIADIPYQETREYVVKVLNSYQKYLALYSK